LAAPSWLGSSRRRPPDSRSTTCGRASAKASWRARAVHVGRNQAVCSCEVFAVAGGTEKLCALAQGSIARLPDAKAPVVTKDPT
jgi:hypothetical protein